jgi:hypothetical protein
MKLKWCAAIFFLYNAFMVVELDDGFMYIYIYFSDGRYIDLL